MRGEWGWWIGLDWIWYIGYNYDDGDGLVG